MKYGWTLALLAACAGGGSDDDDDSNPMMMLPKATAFEIMECKSSCNQLKFFDCNDSVEQAGCYRDCDSATSSQIELFTGCVQTDICDPTCSTHIKPAAMQPPVESDSGPSNARQNILHPSCYKNRCWIFIYWTCT